MNIQSDKNGKAKTYQVRQVLEALGRLANDDKGDDELDCEAKDETNEQA